MVRCHRFILPLLMMTGSVFGVQLVNPTFDTEHGWEKWRDGKQVERRLSENGRNGRCAFISAPAGEKGAYLQRLKNPVPWRQGAGFPRIFVKKPEKFKKYP